MSIRSLLPEIVNSAGLGLLEFHGKREDAPQGDVLWLESEEGQGT